jgi:uncharacterized protein (TIGR02421 family)
MFEINDSIKNAIRLSNETFKACARKTKILSSISWSNEIATQFIKEKATKNPKPLYAIDKEFYKKTIEELKNLEKPIQGEHPVLEWLRQTQKSYILGTQLLLELETPQFYKISSEMYGNSTSKPFQSADNNLQMARKISERVSVCRVEGQENKPTKTAEEFKTKIEEWLKRRRPYISVKVEISNQIVSRVVAGGNRIRIRKDAKFSNQDLSSLWNHEILSHTLTAQNGLAHKNCDFLYAGGPRTTMTQEGLAVFYEIFEHSMSQNRFLALCDRIEAVSKVEQGANFIELYQWYTARTENEYEAFYATQRIFRGSDLKGKYPFTKDVVYLGGVFGVYNFLRLAVKNENYLLVESLINGRIALEDVAVIAHFRKAGFLEPPQYVPGWIRNWEGLLSYFSFSSLINSVDNEHIEGYFVSHFKKQGWQL